MREMPFARGVRAGANASEVGTDAHLAEENMLVVNEVANGS